ERKGSPFDPVPHTNEPAHWVKPEIVVEIKFSEWTADGRLRQPVFIGMRDDKSPRDVTHEPESMAKAPKRSARETSGSARRPSSKRIAASAEVKRPTRVSRVDYSQPERAVSQKDADAIAHRLTEIEADRRGGTLELSSGSIEVSNLDKVF